MQAFLAEFLEVEEVAGEVDTEPDVPVGLVQSEAEVALAARLKRVAAQGTHDEVPSNELVTLDDGDPVDIGADDFVFVDEVRCNGCRLCSAIAPSTFLAELEHGKGRAFQQGGDARGTIDEALGACPTGAISRLSFEELVAAETARANNDKRLPSCAGTCPQAGCYNCPAYPNKGDNPVYQEREAKRARIRRHHRTLGLERTLKREKKIAELL
ncbi:hypothetical protein CTAYLR_007643 [Chrysophaeum taylorii]|uniref:4Fe-4S ferredoxin-type domain-containing protein n=1 Tax=Chrysophaeum taylorii TaxID=2483200 RepID=A0AAD7U4Y6_9STRA|nr:hypothetical protein CTAYLR_007643 [Chrysophaeum taylorii]